MSVMEKQRKMIEVTINQIKQEGRLEIDLSENEGNFYVDIHNIKSVSIMKFGDATDLYIANKYTKEGLREVRTVVEFYRENIKKFLEELE